MRINLIVHEKEIRTIRELNPGDHYITTTLWRQHGRNVNAGHVRIRTASPFTSLTLLGSKVSSFPSDKCILVETERQEIK
jgi:hypothetical protein